MPRREDIESFAQVLNSLGDEPAVRAAHSETIEEVLPPGESPAPGEDEGAGGFSAADEILSTDTGQAAGEQEGLQDLFEGLSALPDEEGEAAGEEPPLPDETGAGVSAEGLDFSSLFGEESEQQPIEELPSRPPQASGRAQRGKAPARKEPGAEEETFSFPEGEPAGLQADLGEMEVLPEEGAPSEEAAPEPAEPSPGVESFEDLGAFSLDAPEAAPSEAAGEAPGEAPQEPGEGEGVDLPNLDELSFGEPLEPLAPAEGQEPPGFEEPQVGENAFEAPEASAPETASLGDLDAASFEVPAEPLAEAGGVEPPGLGEPSAEAAQEPSPEMESLGEESLGNLDLEEFSLPASAEQFGVPAPAPPRKPPKEPPRRAAPKKPQPAPPRRPAPPRAAAGAGAAGAGGGQAEEEVALTPEQFARLRASLDGLPRNLKIAVQDLIGEGAASPADAAKLIGLLVAGASAQDIAALAGRISGKRIRVPAGYEKKSGVAFEAEQRTFAYAFRENILPLLRVVVITVLAGAMVAYLGYSYVYRPLFALSNYRAGYAQIRADRFTSANESFTRATRTWKIKNWYFRYAEAFTDKRQYVLAEEKYEQILRDYPGDRKGILDYAHLETTRLADYEKADRLLQRILDRDRYDYDALLASGDNDIEWADRTPEKYQAARLAYAMLLDKYGVKDELLFRMLRYFIRTDNGGEAERLRAYFASRPDTKIDAGVYAELGGYLIDHRRMDYAQDVLFAAEKAQHGLAEVHYNLARYYRLVQSPGDEKKALDAAVRMMKSSDPLTRKRIAMEIDTHTRLGEYYYGNKEHIAAEKELQAATRLVEQNQRMKLIGRDRLYGRPYADLGDLSYYVQGDLQAAGTAYQNAIANLYTDPELTYKIGFIQYKGNNFRDALQSFTAAEDASAYPSGNENLSPLPTGQSEAENQNPAQPQLSAAPLQAPVNLLYARGNCFYQRGDYFAAQGYYLRLLNRLEATRASIGTLLPEEKPRDRGLLELLAKTNNNLGITMIRLAERTGDRRKRSEAMVYLTAAAQQADTLERNPGDSRRGETMSLPSQNIRAALFPTRGQVPVIIADLPRDFSSLVW
jgi:hypothetical protein